MFRRVLHNTAGSVLLLLPLLSHAGGAETVAQQCAGCHDLEQPDYAALGVDERFQRKAPPLHYAGNKYREEWLESWLQDPQTIHPAGYFPATVIKSTPEGDVPDVDARHQHLALDAATAAEVADYLMTLRPHDELIAESTYTPGSISMRMGMMDFRKFKGCNACHQDAVDEGGFSGPVLHNVWQRLQPAFISSYVQNPVAWDPNAIMPVPQMNESAVHKLVNYLRAVGGEK